MPKPKPEPKRSQRAQRSPAVAADRTRTYGWADPAVYAGMADRPGLQVLRAIVAGEVPPPPMADTLGLDLLEVDEGRVVFSLLPQEWLYNPLGVVHGGSHAALRHRDGLCRPQPARGGSDVHHAGDLGPLPARVTTASGLLRCTGTAVSAGRRRDGDRGGRRRAGTLAGRHRGHHLSCLGHRGTGRRRVGWAYATVRAACARRRRATPLRQSLRAAPVRQSNPEDDGDERGRFRHARRAAPAARPGGRGGRRVVAGGGAVAERGPSIWDDFARVPGAIRDGVTGEPACDHVHRLKEDLGLLAWLGVDAYRFSISWPRVLPTGSGEVSAEGLGFYDALVDGLLERGIRPVATLYHWDLPSRLEAQGGWPVRDTAERSPTTPRWWPSGWATGSTAGPRSTSRGARRSSATPRGCTHPARRDQGAALAAAYHLLLGHGLAVPRMRAAGARDVGIVLNLTPSCRRRGPAGRCGQAGRRHPDRLFLDLLTGRGYRGTSREGRRPSPTGRSSAPRP